MPVAVWKTLCPWSSHFDSHTPSAFGHVHSILAATPYCRLNALADPCFNCCCSFVASSNCVLGCAWRGGVVLPFMYNNVPYTSPCNSMYMPTLRCCSLLPQDVSCCFVSLVLGTLAGFGVISSHRIGSLTQFLGHARLLLLPTLGFAIFSVPFALLPFCPTHVFTFSRSHILTSRPRIFAL